MKKNFKNTFVSIIFVLFAGNLTAMDQKVDSNGDCKIDLELSSQKAVSIGFSLKGAADSDFENELSVPVVSKAKLINKRPAQSIASVTTTTSVQSIPASPSQTICSEKIASRTSHKIEIAPAQNIADEASDLAIEDFFGDRVPNAIDRIIYQLDATKKVSPYIELCNALLLHGPAGTGKTSIAKLIAKKAGRNIEFVSGGDFRTKYQGSAKKELEALFKRAIEKKPVVIIIDEIDGTAAKFTEHSSTQEDNRALKVLIKQLDAYKNDPGIFVIGTTNYLNSIDAAIKRRFACVDIPAPSYDACMKIARYYLKKNNFQVINAPPIKSDKKHIRLGFLMNFCSYLNWYGFTGSDIKEIINNSARDTFEERPWETDSIYSFSSADLRNFKLHTICFSPFIYTFGWLTGAIFHLETTDLEKHIYSNFYLQKKAKA